MSANFIKHGGIIDFAAPRAVNSGDGALLATGLFGVALGKFNNGAAGEFALRGVYDLTKKATDAPAAGAVVYWDDTNHYVTVTSTSNTKIGFVERAAANGDATCRVVLNGTV